MGKLIKGIFGLFFTLVILVIVAIVVIPMVVDPNDYKDEIIAQVKEATGRDLTIRDPLSLSVFPSLAIQLGGVTLSNAKGFADLSFVEVEHLDLKVAVMPILEKRLEVDTVVLKGLKLNLAKNSKGVTNWDDLADSSSDSTAPASSASSDGASESSAADGFALAVKGIQIDDASIDWDDKQAGQHYRLENVSLTTGQLTSGDPVPVQLGIQFTDAVSGLIAELELNATVTASSDLQAIEIPGLSLSLDAKGGDLPAAGVDIDLTAGLAVDMAKDSFSLANMKIQGSGVSVTGGIMGSGLKTSPSVTGQLKLAELDPKAMMKLLSIKLQTADESVLTSLSGDVSFAYKNNGLLLKPLKMKLDDSSLVGEINLVSFEGPVVHADLTLDQIDIDRYLPPKSDPVAATATASATKEPVTSNKSSGVNPLAGLLALDLRAKASIGRLKVSNVRMQDVLVTINSKDGVLNAKPIKANLYGGQLNSSVSIDARQKTPRIHEKANLVGVQISPLLKDLTGDDRLSGTAELHSDLKMSGMTDVEIRKSLGGTASFLFRDGTVKGINLAKMIRDAQAKLGGQSAASDASGDSAQTDFSEMSGSAVIRSGVIDNQDLVAKSPLLRVEGKGKVDLPRDQLNYLVTTTIVKSLEGQGGKSRNDLTGIAIPIRFSGNLNKPDYSLDLSAALNAKAKQAIDEKKEELRAKAQDKVKESLGNALKGLFSR